MPARFLCLSCFHRQTSQHDMWTKLGTAKPEVARRVVCAYMIRRRLSSGPPAIAPKQRASRPVEQLRGSAYGHQPTVAAGRLLASRLAAPRRKQTQTDPQAGVDLRIGRPLRQFGAREAGHCQRTLCARPAVNQLGVEDLARNKTCSRSLFTCASYDPDVMPKGLSNLGPVGISAKAMEELGLAQHFPDTQRVRQHWRGGTHLWAI